MGLTIAQYPVYDGATNVSAYVNIRDLQQTKENGLYTLRAMAKFTTGTVFIQAQYITLSGTTVYTDSWASLYTELKRILNEKNITYTDS